MLSDIAWVDLINLPFSNVSHQSHLGFTSSRSGITSKHQGGTINAVGSACGLDTKETFYRSKCEALERLIVQLTRNIYGKKIIAGRKMSGGPSTEALPITKILPKQSQDNKTDSTGLSIHKNYSMAKQHSYHELLERALLAEFWYGQGLSMEQIDVINIKNTQISIWCKEIAHIHFAIAELYDKHGHMQIKGSAVRLDQNKASQHALSEVLMVYSSHQRGEKPILHSQDSTRERWEALSGPQAKMRHNHFMKQASNKRDHAVEIANKVQSTAVIYPLVEASDWCLTRAIANDVTLMAHARTKEHLADSFI